MRRSALQLYLWQQCWMADDSRFKAGNMSRQIGKSFIVSLEAVNNVIERPELWVLLSAGERQSLELMGKCKQHIEAAGIASARLDEDFFADTKTKQLTITLPNGGRLVGLPANPQTARGFTGNVILDEFAFHRDSEAIWKALFPTISRGYKLRVVSTPQGRGNRFHRIMTGDNDYSRHTVDIYQAVADGVPHNIEELKAGVDDEDTWNQEYLCLFIDDNSAWLTYDMIAACYDETLNGEIRHEDLVIDELPKPQGRVFGGGDLGRVKDLSIFWFDDIVGDVAVARWIITLHKTPFSTQLEVFDALWQYLKPERFCFDATWNSAISEAAQEKYGTYAIEQVVFTNAVKNDLATGLRGQFEDRLVRIPNSRVIRDDLHAVKKTVTAAGNVRFDAERTKDGHSDRFWAKALARMASDQGAVKPELIWI